MLEYLKESSSVNSMPDTQATQPRMVYCLERMHGGAVDRRN